MSNPRLAAVAAMLLAVPQAARAQDSTDFAHDIVPILKARCVECHGNGNRKGALSIDTRADVLKSKAVVLGKSGASELVKRITSNDPDKRMPPKGAALTAVEVAKLKKWIDNGLPWEDGFTFKASRYVAPLKPRRPELPPAQNGRDHPIDRIIDAYFAKNKLTPPGPAEDAVFLRRVTLDLIGQLPTAAERDAFLADKSPDRRAKVVKRLLGEQRAYADHWLAMWNDLLRNEYRGTGYIDGGRKQISAWLYRSIADNKPYDQFVRELISPKADAEGFIAGIKWRGRINASQVPEVQFAQNVSQVFFGSNLKCASCHDSFIDSWKLKDAYGMAAIIADRPLEIHRCDKATGEMASPAFLWPELGAIDPKLPRAKRLERLAELVTHPDNGRFPRTYVNRIWQRLFGRGIVHPVDVMSNEPWSADLLDHLATVFVAEKYDMKKLLEYVCTSNAYAAQPSILTKEPIGDDYVYRGPELRRMTAEQFVDAIRQITHTDPGKQDAPFKPAPFDGPPERRFIRATLLHSDLLMRSLGRPNREQVVTTRPDTLTTLQALDLTNGPILADMLNRGADHLLKTAAKRPLVEDLYIDALGRRPSTEELQTANSLVGSPPTRDGVADLLWSVVMLPEFQLIR